MIDKTLERLLKAPVDTLWAREVILEQAKIIHQINNHPRYNVGGVEEFEQCEVKACVLARRAMTLTAAEVPESAVAAEPVELVVCPNGHSEYITKVVFDTEGPSQTSWHCDDCHANFVFKPEERAFGGLSNSAFQAKLAQYVRDQAQKNHEGLEKGMLFLAAAIIDPAVDVDTLETHDDG